MDGLNSDLNLNKGATPRAMPRIGEWGPVRVPTTRSKRRARWWALIALVVSVGMVVAVGAFAYLQLRG
ncbi:MAG: hypothetical protein ACK5LS_08725 [Propioniciclava sp.]